MGKVIILYDYTGIMAQPWLDNGYEVWCFDGQHKMGINKDGNHVKVGLWFYPDKLEFQATIIRMLVGPDVRLVFGFPECTDLTVAGARHWKKKFEDNPEFQTNAVNLCRIVEIVGNQYGVPWAFENPIGALSKLYRPFDYVFDPCDYAGYLPDDDVHPIYPDIYPPRDRYNKRTCIWAGNGFVMPQHKRLDPLSKDNPGWLKCGGKSTRTKNIRSATPRGFSKAVFIANRQQ